MMNFEVIGDDYKSTFSLKTLNKGEIVVDLLTDLEDAVLTQVQSKYTVKIFVKIMNKHFHLYSEGVKYINHSCNPNMELVGHKFIAKNKIKDGDQLTFDYSKTETDICEAFVCNCGDEACQKVIE